MAAAAAAGGASAAGAAAALRAEALDRRARVMGSSWSLGHGHDAGGEPMQSATVRGCTRGGVTVRRAAGARATRPGARLACRFCARRLRRSRIRGDWARHPACARPSTTPLATRRPCSRPSPGAWRGRCVRGPGARREAARRRTGAGGCGNQCATCDRPPVPVRHAALPDRDGSQVRGRCHGPRGLSRRGAPPGARPAQRVRDDVQPGDGEEWFVVWPASVLSPVRPSPLMRGVGLAPSPSASPRPRMRADWQTHMATTFDDPARRRAAPGPPRRARGRQDEPADYDIITGRPVDPRRTYHPRGARVRDTAPVRGQRVARDRAHLRVCRPPASPQPNPDAAPEAQRTADREYDAIVGRVRDRHRAPAAQDLVSATLRMTGGTASSMRMEHGFVRERPPLGTAAAIRPPTPTGTDYYEAFRR